jgi:hypothetical protein
MSFLTKLPRPRYDTKAFDGFDAAAADFTPGNGKAMAWMSQLAYETDEPDKIKDILAMWGLRPAKIKDRSDGIIAKEVETALPIASTRGVIAHGRGATIVAFAGTDPVVLANWISDFDARIDGKTQAAEGYETAAKAVWEEVSEAIAEPDNDRIFVTGHSLGGALAVLTADRIAGARVAGVYTFGMPRPGTAIFAERYMTTALGARTFRLVHADDLVPTVAPSDFGSGFHHVGYYLHRDHGEKFDPSKMIKVVSSPNPKFENECPDDPQFENGVSKRLHDVLHSPLAAIAAPFQRWKLALSLVFGRGPADMRHDAGGIAIELLPPRLRDHMPDRYIGGF